MNKDYEFNPIIADGVIKRKECYNIIKEQRDYEESHDDNYKGDLDKRIASYNLALHDMDVCDRIVNHLKHISNKAKDEGLDKTEEIEYYILYQMFFNKP